MGLELSNPPTSTSQIAIIISICHKDQLQLGTFNKTVWLFPRLAIDILLNTECDQKVTVWKYLGLGSHGLVSDASSGPMHLSSKPAFEAHTGRPSHICFTVGEIRIQK